MNAAVTFNPSSGNIYMFGDSLNDPGQFVEIKEGLFLDKYDAELQSPKGTRKVTQHFRAKNGCATDGKIQAEFVAEKLGMQHHKGCTLLKLPEGHGNLINFCLGGAAYKNNSNIYFSKDDPSYDVAFQVKKADALVTQFSKDDLSIIQVTLNDIFQIHLASLGMQGNWEKQYTPEELEQNYVLSAVENVALLYNKGCRKIVMPILTNLKELQFPNWKKTDSMFPGTIDKADERLKRMQTALKETLFQKVKTEWQELAIEIPDAGKWWIKAQKKLNPHATITDINENGATTKQLAFFYDDIHPSSAAHKKLAKQLVQVFTK